MIGDLLCLIVMSRKYEEISPPNVEDFCYITDNTYTKQEVVKMEADLLKHLNYELGSPTIKTFLRYYSNAMQFPFSISAIFCNCLIRSLCFDLLIIGAILLDLCRNLTRVAQEDYKKVS